MSNTHEGYPDEWYQAVVSALGGTVTRYETQVESVSADGEYSVILFTDVHDLQVALRMDFEYIPLPYHIAHAVKSALVSGD